MGERIGASADVVDAGTGLPFRVQKQGRIYPAFVIRYGGQLYGYLNACAHVGIRLDSKQNEFFSGDKQYLLCTSHGATYTPDTGACVRGPCSGRGLIPLTVHEDDGYVIYEDQTYSLVAE